MESGGSNFSVGERQLLCIARSIVKKPQVLLMDEATANIDHKTDSLIQEMIHTEFKNSTVITIAHRINTIVTYDRIMGLNNGVLEEMDTPENLLNKENSLFSSLVKENGEEFEKKMRDIIRREKKGERSFLQKSQRNNDSPENSPTIYKPLKNGHTEIRNEQPFEIMHPNQAADPEDNPQQQNFHIEGEEDSKNGNET